jgi:hypothetical protein
VTQTTVLLLNLAMSATVIWPSTKQQVMPAFPLSIQSMVLFGAFNSRGAGDYGRKSGHLYRNGKHAESALP